MIAAADLNRAADGMSRDLDELLSIGWFGLIILAIVFGLPLASLVAIMFQRWLAVLPLLISIGQFGAWFAYYAIGFLGPQSGPGMLWLGVFVNLVGWTILWVAVSRPWRRREGRARVLRSP